MCEASSHIEKVVETQNFIFQDCFVLLIPLY